MHMYYNASVLVDNFLRFIKHKVAVHNRIPAINSVAESNFIIRMNFDKSLAIDLLVHLATGIPNVTLYYTVCVANVSLYRYSHR